MLHVHAVQDTTNVRAYLPKVEAFLAEARSRGWALNTFAERDRALADMIAILCYVEKAGIQRGRNLFAGFIHVYPEHGGNLPEADRALKSWERLDTSGEGGPICEEAWAAVIVAFVRDADEEGGLVSAVSLDCLLRGQDWSKLRLEDVAFNTRADGSLEASLMLGARKRGETTKTGSRQGVVVERQWVAAWLQRHCEQRRADGATFVFSMSLPDFRIRYARQLERLQIAAVLRECDAETPHALRHGGAALMIGRGDERKHVKTRGRWDSDKSLKRYTKTHLLVAQRAALPAPVLALGRVFLSAPALELRRAQLNILAPRDG